MCCCSARSLKKLLRGYLKNKCQSISPVAICDLQNAIHEFVHQVLQRGSLKARRKWEPVHLANAIEELFPCNQPLQEFAADLRRRVKRQLFGRNPEGAEEDSDDTPEDKGGSSG